MTDTPAPEATLAYPEYLTRFERLVGDLQVGQYGRFKGRLVPKMDEPAFAEKVAAYLALGHRFSEMIAAGDTIDDGLAVELRSAEIELVLERSLFIPSFGQSTPSASG